MWEFTKLCAYPTPLTPLAGTDRSEGKATDCTDVLWCLYTYVLLRDKSSAYVY